MTQGWRATAKQNRRELYLSAAARLFAERGFRGVSIDDLGAAAGVSGPALYRHFAGKDAILIELLVQASERLLAGGRSVVAEHGRTLAALRELIDFHVDFALAERDVIRIQDRELASLPPSDNRRVRLLQRRYVQLWVDLLADLHPDGEPRLRQARVMAVFGLLNSTPFSAARSDVEPTRRLLARMALVCLMDTGTSG